MRIDGWDFDPETQPRHDEAYPGLSTGEYGPTEEVLGIAESPLQMFLFFMPPRLWRRIQNRAQAFTRHELFRVTEADVKEEHLIRIGQRLERTTEQLRWSFKRVSNWERDQTITEIRNVNGKPFTREMTTADRFGSEWEPILGHDHSTVKSADLEAELDKFVRIPDDRRVTQQQNAGLMSEITTDDVVQAIAALNRHKAAGPDGYYLGKAKGGIISKYTVPIVVCDTQFLWSTPAGVVHTREHPFSLKRTLANPGPITPDETVAVG
ncbi:hypothetical protein PR003_g4032 [Phytophthora rubi]|uniref:Uncharacterized protein n=1 Tax=Phytophthora rubi TaxID=129364 RepID=A0A6A4FU14_9STRA|nr:hypothetical protein PR001_g14699 [Phytophthora rubi]KAE9353131.1 hypothetical protein PR003_g4032 [Phytophthora rubi]